MDRYERARKIIEEAPCTEITTVQTQVLCDYLRVTSKTLRERVKANAFPTGIRLGRENVWRLADVRKHLSTNVKNRE